VRARLQRRQRRVRGSLGPRPPGPGGNSFYKIGQYANYGTIAAAPQGTVHFAGEHTSINNQGFLDGAVETGARAAREIVAQR